MIKQKDTVIYSREFVDDEGKKGRTIVRADLGDLVDQIRWAVEDDVFEGAIDVTIELKRESEG